MDRSIVLGNTDTCLLARPSNLIQLSAEEEEEFARFDAYESEPEEGEGELDSNISYSTSSADSELAATANLIQSYTAILILAILNDDFKKFNKAALIRFVARCQNKDGS